MDFIEFSPQRRRQVASQRVVSRMRREPTQQLHEWLQCWNDNDSDLGNLRNFEHWLRCCDAAKRVDQPD
jgi:hypothetical protein